jgi:hypothetical protein
MEHCGVCTSCLLRRTALNAALGTADATRYRDVLTRARGRYELEAFELHAIRVAEASGSFDSLLNIDPDVRWVPPFFVERGVPDDSVRNDLCDLCRRFAAETLAFLRGRRPCIQARQRPRTNHEVTHDLFAAAR